MTVYEPKTQFVANLIPRVYWANRAYIQDLLRIEAFASRDTRGVAGALARHHLTRQYPLEAAAILAEMQGCGTTPVPEIDVVLPGPGRSAEEERAAAATRLAELNAEIASWRGAGGSE